MKNIINLIYKDLKLLIHPVTCVYIALAGIMSIIPNYPRFVGPLYMLIGIMLIMTNEAQYMDKEFCGILPVSKSDSVKARIIVVVLLEVITVIASVIVAVIVQKDFKIEIESFTIEPNLIMVSGIFLSYAAANALMVSANYRKNFKTKLSSLLGILAYSIVSSFIEFGVTSIPGLEFMRTNADSDLMRQLPFAIASLAIYAGANYVICRQAIKNFEKAEI